MLHNRKYVIRGELWHSSIVRPGKILSINIEPFANLGLGLRLQDASRFLTTKNGAKKQEAEKEPHALNPKVLHVQLKPAKKRFRHFKSFGATGSKSFEVRIEGLVFRVWGLRFGIRIHGLELRVQGSHPPGEGPAIRDSILICFGGQDELVSVLANPHYPYY